MPEFKENKSGYTQKSPAATTRGAYLPFKMKAADYGNSPMRKNFGVGDPEAPDKTSPLTIPFMPGAIPGAMVQSANPNKVQLNKGPMFAEGGRAPSVPKHGPESHTGIGGGRPTIHGGAGGTGGVPGSGKDRANKPTITQEEEGGGGGGFSTALQTALPGIGGNAPTGGSNNPNLPGAFWSDIRLKEKIHRTGNSPSGIPIYEFSYIGDSNRYSGTMAQDLLEINPDAVSMDTSGYYKVNYNNIDVDMHLK